MEALASIEPQPVLETYSRLRKSGRDRLRSLRKKILPLFTGMHCRNRRGYVGRNERKSRLRHIASYNKIPGSPSSDQTAFEMPEYDERSRSRSTARTEGLMARKRLGASRAASCASSRRHL